MLQKLKVWIAAGTSLLAFSAPALMAGTSGGPAGNGSASSDDIMSAESGQRALLDTMVKKGLITDQEAEEIGLKMQEDEVQSSAYRLNLAASIKRLTLYGDIRLRYESRDGQDGTTAAPSQLGGVGTNGANGYGNNQNQTQTRDRFRYRLRLGLKADLTDQWFAGIRMNTNLNNDRSGNVTFGDNDSAGPYGKDKSQIGVDLVYIGYKPTDWLTITGGQIMNPFYTTNLIWDPNINPDGISEQFTKRVSDHVEIFANALQSLYASGNGGNQNPVSTSVPTGSPTNDMFMFDEQIGVNLKYNDNISAKAALGLMTYTGANEPATVGNGSPLVLTGTGQDGQGFGGPFNGDVQYNGVGIGGANGPDNNIAVNNLTVIDAPAELDFKAWNLPFRVFEDFADNADASTRARLADHPGRGADDGWALEAGLQVGAAKKKGEWEAKSYWLRRGTYSLDPNLVDADIFDGRTNMQGEVLTMTYDFSDAISATVTGAIGGRIDDSVGTDGYAMGTPGTGEDLGLAAIQQYKLVQADLNWKF